LAGKEQIRRIDNLSSMRSEIRNNIGAAVVLSCVFAIAALALHISLPLLHRDCRTVFYSKTISNLSSSASSEAPVWIRTEVFVGMALDERNSSSTEQPLRKIRSVFMLPPRKFSGDRPFYSVPYFTFQKILWAALPVRAGPSFC